MAWVAGVGGLQTIITVLVIPAAVLTVYVQFSADPSALRKPVDRRTVLLALSVPLLIVTLAFAASALRS